MSKPIVVGVDGQPDSKAALDWAIAEAAERGTRLMLVHVGGHAWTTAPSGGVGLLERTVVDNAVATVRAVNQDIRISSVIAPGSPGDVLTSWASEASMIVLGHRGLGAVGSIVHGSVGAAVAGQAQCPVVVVGTPPGPRAPVVVGIDGSTSAAAVDFAFDFAARHATWVRAVHTWQRGSGELVPQRVKHHELLYSGVAAARERHPGIPVQHVRILGHAAEILAEESMNAQLLVVGTRGRKALFGSVSRSLLRTANCPLAVVPPE